EARRRDAVRAVLEPLRLADQELVVDPSMRRMEPVGILVVGRNDDLFRAGDAHEILRTPRVLLHDGHWAPRPPEPLYRPGRAETLGRDPQRPTGRRPKPPLPPAREPQAQAVEVEVYDGGGEEGEELAHDEPAHDGDAERAAQLGPRARAERPRQGSQPGRHGGQA